MNFLRRHKTTFAMAVTFGVSWIVASTIMSVVSDEGSLHWSGGIVAAAFMILLGVMLGLPEERRRRRERRGVRRGEK